MTGYLLVLSTVPDEKMGQDLARSLVEERLAACVTVSAASRSFYRWQGKIAQETEFMLYIKTKASLYTELEARIKSLHPYSVPEIIALPLDRGSNEYLRWLDQETQS
jgi:periplasmic divalent cation tolerance protein